jgi:hypothetical protein
MFFFHQKPAEILATGNIDLSGMAVHILCMAILGLLSRMLFELGATAQCAFFIADQIRVN